MTDNTVNSDNSSGEDESKEKSNFLDDATSTEIRFGAQYHLGQTMA